MAPRMQAKDTYLNFPFFNFKQKRHGASKIKISFHPFPNLYPSFLTTPLFITLKEARGAGVAGISSWGESRGLAERSGAELLPNINTRVSKLLENPPPPPPRHSPLSAGRIWRGGGEEGDRHGQAAHY